MITLLVAKVQKECKFQWKVNQITTKTRNTTTERLKTTTEIQNNYEEMLNKSKETQGDST